MTSEIEIHNTTKLKPIININGINDANGAGPVILKAQPKNGNKLEI